MRGPLSHAQIVQGSFTLNLTFHTSPYFMQTFLYLEGTSGEQQFWNVGFCRAFVPGIFAKKRA